MLVDTNSFPHLKSGEYIGLPFGKIVILDKSISEEKKKWLEEEYKKWWDKRFEERCRDYQDVRSDDDAGSGNDGQA